MRNNNAIITVEKLVHNTRFGFYTGKKKDLISGGKKTIKLHRNI